MRQAPPLDAVRPPDGPSLTETNEVRPLTIVHLGAGGCSELDEYLTLKVRRIVLVEANPDEARRLSRRVAAFPEVEVIPAAIAPAGGKATLKIFNLPAYSSLRSPTGLRELYPGLRLRNEVEVDALTPVELFERIQPDPAEANWLIVDIPGEEAATVEALQNSDSLASFERIVLRCGTVPLYDGAGEAGMLLELLRKDGYDIASGDNADPAVPNWVLQKSPLRLENRELWSRLEALQEKLQTQIRLATSCEEKLAQATAARDEQARSAAERQAELERVRRERDEQARRTAAVQAEFEKMKEAFYAQVSHLKHLEAERGDFSRERQELKRQIEHMREENRDLEQRLRECESAAEQNQAHASTIAEQLGEAQHTACLSVKLQALREADLKELQGRYAEVVAVQERQHELLEKICEDLKNAASSMVSTEEKAAMRKGAGRK